MYEAFPQFLSQFYFLVSLNINSANTFELNGLVTISTLISLFSIISKKWSQDKELANPNWQNLDFNSKKTKILVL